MSNLYGALQYIWQLPQNIVGLLYLAWLRASRPDDISRMPQEAPHDVRLWRTRSSMGSVSLGQYVFVSGETSNMGTTIQHELGHAKQSLLLGPLYLIVIGIPSITWAAMRMCGFFRSHSYYSFYTESWADRNAGISRHAHKRER